MRIVGTICLLLIAATEVPPSFLRSDAPALEVTTIIAPVTHDEYQLLKRATPGMFRCIVRVHEEPGSKRVWGTKDILLGPGETGEQTATLGPLHLTFRAKIERSLDRAETTVTVS